MELIPQTHILQRFGRTAAALTPGNTGDGQRQFHIGKNRLMGNQIVTLENEADGVVAVGIPIPVGILPGGDAVDDQIAAVISIQTAHHIQQRGLAGAAGAQNGNKFIVPEVQADPIQGRLDQFTGHIFLSNLFDLEHDAPPSSRQKW